MTKVTSPLLELAVRPDEDLKIRGRLYRSSSKTSCSEANRRNTHSKNPHKTTVGGGMTERTHIAVTRFPTYAPPMTDNCSVVRHEAKPGPCSERGGKREQSKQKVHRFRTVGAATEYLRSIRPECNYAGLRSA